MSAKRLHVMFDDDDILLDAIKETKAFSYIIDDKYGGNKLNVETQSRILVKLASFNPSLGVTVMVPNSLGPGELLQHYGIARGLRIGRKHLGWYSKGFPCSAMFREKVNTSDNYKEVQKIINEFLVFLESEHVK